MTLLLWLSYVRYWLHSPKDLRGDLLLQLLMSQMESTLNSTRPTLNLMNSLMLLSHHPLFLEFSLLINGETLGSWMEVLSGT
jgi:hypothetical protein